MSEQGEVWPLLWASAHCSVSIFSHPWKKLSPNGVFGEEQSAPILPDAATPRSEQQVRTQRPGSTKNVAAECFSLRNSPITVLMQTKDALYQIPLTGEGVSTRKYLLTDPASKSKPKTCCPMGITA